MSKLLALATTANGIHLRYGTVTPGLLNATHTNDIQIDSFQLGLSRPVSGGTGGITRSVGKVAVSEATLTHQMDKFSVPLLKQSLIGTGTTASLYFTNLNGTGGAPLDYLQIDLPQSLVSDFSMSSGGDNPSESFSLNFTSMTFKYKVSSTAIPITVTYNLATGVTT